MNKVILSLSLVFLMSACQQATAPSQEELVKQAIAVYSFENANGELTALTLIDSVSYTTNINSRKEFFQMALDYEQGDLDRQLDYIKSNPTAYDDNKVIEIKKAKAQLTGLLEGISNIETEMGEQINGTASYIYSCNFGEQTYFILTGGAPDFKILEASEDKNRLNINAGEFPGYEDLVKKLNYIGA